MTGPAIVPAPPGTGRGRRASDLLAVVALAGFGIWTVSRALSTEGFLEADEVAHYLYARHAPAHPMNLLHVWARPLYTLALAPFAQAGLPGARLLAPLSAVAAAACAWLACRALGWRVAACAVPLVFAQPLFFQQSAGLWTEMTFSAMFGAWILAVAAGRPRLVAAVAALLPLVRPEGLVIAGGTAVLALAGVLRDRGGRPARLAPLLIIPSGVVLWAAIGWVVSGDPLWLPHHWPPNWAPSVAYGHGSWGWIADVMPVVLPRIVIPLALLGCFAPGMRRAWPIAFACVLVLGVHAILWRYGAFGTAGYARYCVTLAPAFAVLATGGVEIVARAARFVPAPAWLAAAAAFALFFLMRHPTATLRPPMPPDGRLFAALGKWIRTQDPDPVLFSAHPFAYLELDSVPPDRFEDFGDVATAVLRAAPVGSWVLVEDRFYSTYRPSVATVRGNPDERELLTLGFERVATPDLGVDLAVADERHDRSIERMQWALYRKKQER